MSKDPAYELDRWAMKMTRKYFDKGKEPMNYNSGTVVWIKENPWKDKVFYTFTLDGEDDMFYQAGEGTTAIQHMILGDTIEFQWQEVKNKKGYLNKEVDLGSVKVSSGEGRIEPSTGAVEGKTTGPTVKDLRGTWAGCSNRAIEFVNVLIKNGAIELPEKKPGDKLFALVELWTAAFFKSVMDTEAQLQVLGLGEDDEDKPDWL